MIAPRWARWALVVGLTLSASSAAAQRRPRTPRNHPVPPTPPPPPGSQQTATTPTPSQPTAETLETARRLFREGVAAAQREDWGEARERFALAIQIHPSPLLRFNLALASRNTGRLVEALGLYRQFVREATEPTNAERREAALREIAGLEPRLAWLRVEVEGDTVHALRLDGQVLPLGMLRVEIPVDPGPHVVEVEGEHGDVQRREGTVTERGHERVSFALSPRRPPASEGSAGWQARTQTFGRRVGRAGPGGRWLEWAAQESEEGPVWSQFPVTIALQGGLNHAVGGVSLSARYFPQRWLGLEATLGAVSGWGPGFGLAANLRVPLGRTSRHALGLQVGISSNVSEATLNCVGSACNRVSRQRTLYSAPAWLNVAFTYEWRFTRRFSARVLLGARVLTNVSDFRDVVDRTQYDCARPSPLPFGGHPCQAWSGEGGAALFTALDVGYSF